MTCKPVGSLLFGSKPLGSDIAGNPAKLPILPMGSLADMNESRKFSFKGSAVVGLVGAINPSYF